jgi:hypothetical protein
MQLKRERENELQGKLEEKTKAGTYLEVLRKSMLS